jgi:hypothetical protein
MYDTTSYGTYQGCQEGLPSPGIDLTAASAGANAAPVTFNQKVSMLLSPSRTSSFTDLTELTGPGTDVPGTTFGHKVSKLLSPSRTTSFGSGVSDVGTMEIPRERFGSCDGVSDVSDHGSLPGANVFIPRCQSDGTDDVTIQEQFRMIEQDIDFEGAQILGDGLGGKVFKARLRKTQEVVAVKTIHLDTLKEGEVMDGEEHVNKQQLLDILQEVRVGKSLPPHLNVAAFVGEFIPHCQPLMITTISKP